MENLLKQEKPIMFFHESDEKLFDELLTTIYLTDTWEYVNIPEIKICLAENEDEKTEDKILIKLNGNKYSVHPLSMRSIEKRAMDEARINERLPIKTRIRRLNEDFSVAYKKTDGEPLIAKGLIRGEQLLALLSERYVPFTQKQIFDIFNFSLNINFTDVSFEGAVYTHSSTEARYQIVDNDLIELYREALREVKHPLAEEEIIMKIVLSTSDVGAGCISVIPTLSFKGSRQDVPFSTALKVEHRDKTEFADVEKAFSSVFSLANEGIKNFAKLLTITIKHPVECAQNIAKKYYLPKSEVDDLEPQLRYYSDTGTPLSAHEFYLILSDILNSRRYKDMHAEKKLFIRDGLSKMLTFEAKEWLKYDKPKL